MLVADPPLTDPHRIPLIKNGALEQIVSEGRRAVVANLVAEWTPQGLTDEAFDDALSETRRHWLQDAIDATGVLRPAERVHGHLARDEQIVAQREAYHELITHFINEMVREKCWIMRQARAKLLDRAERIVIRVKRHSIEIVDLYQNESYQTYGQQKPHLPTV